MKTNPHDPRQKSPRPSRFPAASASRKKRAFPGYFGFGERCLAGVAALALMGAGSLRADTVVKANNNNALNLSTSWTGGAVPTADDVALWDSTVGTNWNSPIGGDLSFGGIRITDTGGTLMTISGSGNKLTLGASGIDMSASNADLRLFDKSTATVELGADQTWNVGAGRLLRVSGAVTGAHALTIAGTGTTELDNNANSYSGDTTISAGATILINSSGSTNTPFGSGLVTIGNNVALMGTSKANRYVSNAIKLNGDLTLGSSTLDSSSFHLLGGLDVGGGTRTISLVNNGAVAANSPALDLSGEGMSVTGAGGNLVLVNGNADTSYGVYARIGVSVTAYSVHTGLTVGSDVTLYFGIADVLGADCDLTIQSGGVVDLSTKASSATDQTVKSLSGGGTLTSYKTTAGVSTLTIDGGSAVTSSTFSGNIVTGPIATVALTKLGTTRQILSGDDTYTGQTQIGGGALLIDGTHLESSAVSNNGYGSADSGHFQVAAGAAFGGSGRIAGNNSQANSNLVLVQSGAVLTPGDGIGALTLDGANLTGANSRLLNMADGAKFAFELSGTGGTSDQVVFWNYASGDLLLNSNQIDLTLSGAVAAGTYTVSLFRFYSDSGVTAVDSGITSGLTVGTVGEGIADTATLNYNAANGSIDLTYTVVPEPSALALAGIGIAFGLGLARRRRAARFA